MLYLFHGDDDYTVRALARAVEARYAGPAGSPSVLRLDGATTPWDDVVAAKKSRTVRKNMAWLLASSGPCPEVNGIGRDGDMSAVA